MTKPNSICVQLDGDEAGASTQPHSMALDHAVGQCFS